MDGVHWLRVSCDGTAFDAEHLACNRESRLNLFNQVGLTLKNIGLLIYTVALRNSDAITMRV